MHVECTHIITFAASPTRRSVKEILLHRVTNIRSKFWRCARQTASLRVASVGVVVRSIAAHQSLALQISAGTLPTGTLQLLSAIAAVGAVWLCRIRRTSTITSRTSLLRITYAGGRSAYVTSSSELATACAASIICGVTNSPSPQLAGCGYTAAVGTTAFWPTTVALFRAFHNPIATLISRNCRDTFVVREATALDRIPSQCAADVSQCAGRELGDSRPRRRIHDILSISVTRRGRQWTALLSIDSSAIGASLTCAVMDCAKSMP